MFTATTSTKGSLPRSIDQYYHVDSADKLVDSFESERDTP
jgi:hypothetical protein